MSTIKPKNQYNAPFDIEYDILSKLDVLVDSFANGDTTNNNDGCACSEYSEIIIDKLQGIKDSIDNKECTNTETIIEKPYIIEQEVIVEKPIETIVYKDKIVYKYKIVEKPLYIERIIYKYIKDDEVVDTEIVEHIITNDCACSKKCRPTKIIPKEVIEEKERKRKDYIALLKEKNKPKQPEKAKYLVMYGNNIEPVYARADTKHFIQLPTGKYARLK